MITLFYKNNNPFNQETYDNVISQVDLLTINCPSCHHTGHLIRHAKYKRTIRTSTSNIDIYIVRTKCKHCGKTHALLLCDFVPYSQILFKDQLDIITDTDNDEKLLSDKPNLNISDFKYVRIQFKKYWKEMLHSESILLDLLLSFNCFYFFKRQFMQIKCTINSYHYLTHTGFF